jgi:outer membrane protein assembly factor BamD
LRRYTTSEALYQASFRQFERGKWDDAVSGFEKLTFDLPSRDTLLPRSFWYLARSYQEQREHVLAAQTFNRLYESFPDDSLAAPAALRSAREYWKLWPKPDLDPTYGETALQAYTSVQQFFASSPQADTAGVEANRLLDQFAQRDYKIGMYYFRDEGFDSALIYFRDLFAKYPDTPTARLTGLRMLEAFRAIRYAEDAAELCEILRARYDTDQEILRACPVPPGRALPPDTTLREVRRGTARR